MASQPAPPPFLTFVNYIESQLDDRGLIRLPENIVQPIFESPEPLIADGINNLIKRFSSSQIINCYRLEAGTFSELVKVVFRLPASSKQEKLMGIYLNCFQSWAQIRGSSTHVSRLKAHGLSIATVDIQQVEAGKMLVGWMIDILAKERKAKHTSYLMALFISTLCYHQAGIVDVLADRLTLCGHQLGTTILTDPDPISRVLTANIVRDLLYHYPERWVYWPTHEGVLESFPIAERADRVWLQSLWAFFDAVDLGKGFHENDARPQALSLSEVDIPGIETGGRNNFIICSLSAEVVLFTLPATSEKAMRYLEVPLAGFTNVEISDEESGDSNPSLQVVLSYANNKGMCIENGSKRALSRFAMTPIGDVFVLHDVIELHLPKAALQSANGLETPLRSETEIGDTEPLDETNSYNSVEQNQQVQSNTPIPNCPSSPFTMLESNQEVVQVRDSQPKHVAVGTVHPHDGFPTPIADIPKPSTVDAEQFSAANYLGASHVIDELAGQHLEVVRDNPEKNDFEERTDHKAAGFAFSRSGNVSDEVAEDSYPLNTAERIEPLTTPASNFLTAMTKTLDNYTLAEPGPRRVNVTPRSLQTPKKRDTRKADIGDPQSTKRLKDLAGTALSEPGNLRQKHTEGTQNARSEEGEDTEAVDNKSEPESNTLATEQASETPIRLPKKLTTKYPKGKKAKKPKSGAKAKKLPKSNSSSRARTTALQQDSTGDLPAQQEVDLNNEITPAISKQASKDELNDQRPPVNVQAEGTLLNMNSVTGFEKHQSVKPSSGLSRELAPTDLSDNEEAGDDEVDQARKETFQRAVTPTQQNTRHHPLQIPAKKHRKGVAIASIPQKQLISGLGSRRQPRTPSINDENQDSGKVKIVHFDAASIGKSSITSAASRRSKRLRLGYQATTETGKKRSVDAVPSSDRTDNMSPSLRLSQRSNQDNQQPAVEGDDSGILTVEDFASDDSSSPAVSKLDLVLTNHHVPAKDAFEANAKVDPQRPRHLSDKQDALASITSTFADPQNPTKSSAPEPAAPKTTQTNFVVEITTKASVAPKTAEQHNIPKPTDEEVAQFREKNDQGEVPPLARAVGPTSLSRDSVKPVKSPAKEQPRSKNKPPDDVASEVSRVNDTLDRPLPQQADANVVPESYQNDRIAANEAKSPVHQAKIPRSTVQRFTIQQPSVQVEISPQKPVLVPMKGRETVSKESSTNKTTDEQSTSQLRFPQRPTPAGIIVTSAKEIQESSASEKSEMVAPIAQAPILEAQKLVKTAMPIPKDTCNSTRPSAIGQLTMPRPKKITKPASEGVQSQASPRSPKKTQENTKQTLVTSAHVTKARPRLETPKSATPASQDGKNATNEACGEQSLQPTRKIVRIDPPTPPQRLPLVPVSSVSTFFADFRKDNGTLIKAGETNDDRNSSIYDFDEGDTTLIDTPDTTADTHSNTGNYHSSSGDTHLETEADGDIANGDHRAHLGRAPGGGKYQDVLDAFTSVTGQIVNRLEAAEEAFSMQRNILDAGIEFTMKELLKCQEKEYKKQKDDLRPRIQKLGQLYSGIGDRVKNDYSNGEPPVPPSLASAKEILGDLEELEKTLY